jgi:hypothetical protein
MIFFNSFTYHLKIEIDIRFSYPQAAPFEKTDSLTAQNINSQIVVLRPTSTTSPMRLLCVLHLPQLPRGQQRTKYDNEY